MMSDRPASEIVDFDVHTDEMLINMGPQHPSTHGVLRVALRTDGEVVTEVTPHIGYLHRSAEKIGENLTPRQFLPYTDRLDYLAGMNMNLGWALCVEKLLGQRVSEKTRHLRIIITELSRIASHLVAAGCRNVLLLERETSQGKGSTGKSMGGVRAQFSTPVNIQMSLYSIPFYATFEERLCYPCDYRPQGYLFCATNEKHLAYLRANYEKQVAMGLKNVRLVAGDEIRGMFPQMRGDDIVGGSFCSTDGFVDPYSVMKGFMAAAAEHGARLWRGVDVTGIDVDARGIAGVIDRKSVV